GIASGTVGAGLLLAHFGRSAAVTSIVVVLVTTMLVTVLVVPDRAAPVEGQFRSARELLSKTFAVPFRNRDFLWLMVSRLLIFMGFGGLQNFAFFYFDNVFFQHDRKATTIAASTLLGLSIGVAALITWPASRFSDRIGRKPLIFTSGLFGAAGTLLLVFSHFLWVPEGLLSPLARLLKVPDLAGLRPWGGLGGGEPADFVVAGIPYGGSALYREGAAVAPQGIRQLSAAMPPVTEEGHLLAGLHVQDIGDLDAGGDIEAGWMRPMERLARVSPNAFLTVLGGDHCTAIATLAAQVRRHPGLSVLWVDAHPDLCDFSRGGSWTCGCALRRALEASGIEASRVVIAGGRDYDPEELEYVAKNGILLVSSAEIARDLPAAARKISERLAGQTVHVSFDIDVLDPAFAPGTE